MISDADLIPEVISIGLSRAFRIKRIGIVFMVENLHITRDLDKHGKEILGESWKVVAIVKASIPPGPKPPKQEAFEWMHDAQRQALAKR